MNQLSESSPVLCRVRNGVSLSRILGIALAAFFSLAPTTRGVTPAPEGGYPNNNTAAGEDALAHLTSGEANTAIGAEALFSETYGGYNTATGSFALYMSTGGVNNTASGHAALYSNQTGAENTGMGARSLYNNTTGAFNTANGSEALYLNSTGLLNTASGFRSLYYNTAGNRNTADGVSALFSNTTGSNNTAAGYYALHSNTTGEGNTGVGYGSLLSHQTGVYNTSVGYRALHTNPYGTVGISNNTAIGANALYRNGGAGNTATGFNALGDNTTGENNIAVGVNAGSLLTTGNNNISIGALGVAGESNTIRIGQSGREPVQKRTFVQGIFGSTVPNGAGVVVNAAGKLGTITSSARFKQDIQPMDTASEGLLELEPVTFRYHDELDPDGTQQFGLIAEQVEKVNPNLVARGSDGKVNTVRYEAINAMLLNEFLKERREVQEQKATIAELRARDAKQDALIAEQQKQIEALSAGLQKLSNQAQVAKPKQHLSANSR